MTRQYIEEHDVVARYLADQLSDSEREKFEAYYFDNPELLRELNQTAQFKAGLSQLQSDGLLQKLLQSKPWWRKTPGLAIAASLLIAVAIGFGSIQFIQTSSPFVASTPLLATRLHPTLTLGPSVYIERTRTVSYDATITLPADRSAVEIRLKPDFAAAQGNYRVMLGRVGAQDVVTHIGALSQVQVTDAGYLQLFLDSRALAVGVYEISLFDASDLSTKGGSQFLLEIMAAAN